MLAYIRIKHQYNLNIPVASCVDQIPSMIRRQLTELDTSIHQKIFSTSISEPWWNRLRRLLWRSIST
jgi:hypothetical protein